MQVKNKKIMEKILSFVSVFWEKLKTIKLSPNTKKTLTIAGIAAIFISVLFIGRYLYKRYYYYPYNRSGHAILDIYDFAKDQILPDTIRKTKALLEKIDLATNRYGKRFLKKNHPNHYRRLVVLFKELKTVMEQYLKELEKVTELEFRIKLSKELIKMGGGIPELKKIVLIRRFDTDKNGNGYYEAMDYNKTLETAKIVIVSNPDIIRKYSFRDVIEIWLSYLGEFPYKETVSNGYTTYKTTNYYYTYKIVPKSENPEKKRKSRLELKKMIEEREKEKNELIENLRKFKITKISPILEEIKQIILL